MSKIVHYISTIFIILLCGRGLSNAFDAMNIPLIDNFVVDHTQTLTPSQINTLSSGAYDIQQQTSAQIAAVIIPDRGGRELYDISLKIFRDNQLGDNTINNGVLLVIAKDEKKLRLTVGYGLEGDIPDVLAREFIEQIRPYVNAGDMYGAIETYYSLVKPYVLSTGKQRVEPVQAGYIFTIWDQIWGITLFFIMSSALGSRRLQRATTSKAHHQQSISDQLITIGTIGLLIIGIVSFVIISFGFIGGLIGYFIGLMTGQGQGFTMKGSRHGGYYSGSRSDGDGWGSSGGGSRGGGGGFSGGFGGGFGGSSGGGGAGD